MSFLRTIMRTRGGAYTGTVTIQKPSTKTVHGITVVDPTSYSLHATTKGTFLPASKAALERAGLLGLSNVLMAYLAPVDVSPGVHQLLANSVTYKVHSVAQWGTHTEALIEQVT